MQASHDFKRVYVWEQPVRWFHWINALCVIVLGVTGYLIAHPPAFMSVGEASSGYWFGKLRFTHFATAYVFLANFLFRLYWAGAGNKYTHWRNFFPISMRQLREVWAVLKVDVLQSSDKPVHTLGHNAVAYFTYMGTGLLTVFQVITGFRRVAALRFLQREKVLARLHTDPAFAARIASSRGPIGCCSSWTLRTPPPSIRSRPTSRDCPPTRHAPSCSTRSTASAASRGWSRVIRSGSTSALPAPRDSNCCGPT